MRCRLFALGLAILVAATPAIGVICEMDCDEPPAASSSCHEKSASHDGARLRGTPHSCDHNHMGGSPALLTSAIGRDSLAAAVAAPVPTLVHMLRPEARLATAALMHGPPGLTGRTTSSQLTVLRI